MAGIFRRNARLLLVGLVILIGGLGAVAAAATGRGPTWDGTWAGGWESGGDGVQLTFVGNKIISIYRHGDYPEVQPARISADGKIVTFAWNGGEATLQRTAEDDARITLRERGRAERSFAIKRE
jgi:hypothetical protein